MVKTPSNEDRRSYAFDINWCAHANLPKIKQRELPELWKGIFFINNNE